MIINNLNIYFLGVTLVINAIATLHLSDLTRTKACYKRSIDYSGTEREQFLKEIMLSSVSLHPETLGVETDPMIKIRKKLGVLIPPPIDIDDEMLKGMNNQKAFACSQLQCNVTLATISPVCACNYNTGNVVSFKNKCETKKHNCRFDTDFHVILNEICPWEFQSRRGSRDFIVNYDDPKYYN